MGHRVLGKGEDPGRAGLCRKTTAGAQAEMGFYPQTAPKSSQPGFQHASSFSPAQSHRCSPAPAAEAGAEPPGFTPQSPRSGQATPARPREPSQEQLRQPQPSTNKPIQTQTAPGTGRGTARRHTIKEIIMDGCRAGLEEPLASSRTHKPPAMPAPEGPR